jgi:hypothetical protein
MTIDTAQYAQFFQQGQEAVRTTFETWTGTVKTAVAQVPALASQFDAEAAVDRYFEVSAKVLDGQRDFAKRLLATGEAVAAAAASKA